MTRFAVDLSDFDRDRGPVDVAAMARDGVSVLSHKATEGTSWRHRYYGSTLAAARSAGIPYLAAYVVPRTPGNGGAGSIAAQYDYLMSYVEAQTPWWHGYPGWFWQVDTEYWSSGGVPYDKVAARYGVEMCRRLADGTGRPVIHYAPRWAYGDTLGGSEPLWSSAYGTNPAVGYRQAYAAAGGDQGPGWAAYSGRVPLAWQFGSRTTIGTQPGCDADAIRDEPSWQAFIRGGAMLPEDVWTAPVTLTDPNLVSAPATYPAGDWLAASNVYASRALGEVEALAAKVEALAAAVDALKAALVDPAAYGKTIADAAAARLRDILAS